MIHIISNPHNGAPVDHNGVVLQPGYEQVVREQVAEELSQRFGFLLMRVVPGTYSSKKKYKPAAIKGTLTFENVEHAGPDVPDLAQHTVTPARAAKKAAPRKKAKKSK